MCGDCIVIFVPETTTLPTSIGSSDSMRNGLKTETPTITSIDTTIATGTALRRTRTSFECRAAAAKRASSAAR